MDNYIIGKTYPYQWIGMEVVEDLDNNRSNCCLKYSCIKPECKADSRSDGKNMSVDGIIRRI